MADAEKPSVNEFYCDLFEVFLFVVFFFLAVYIFPLKPFDYYYQIIPLWYPDGATL